MSLTISFLFVSLFIVICSSVKVQDLGGQWLLKEANGKYEDLEVTVPGGIYSDLMSHDIIENIFYGYNDDTTRWVPRSNWTYYTQFDVDEDLLKLENVNIVFEGLDTFANIFINDVAVGESKNMFVRYIFNIKEQLKSGNNKIEVQFKSPIEVADIISQEQNKSYSIPLNCPPDAYRGECHVNMIRKMQASYAWDWGPSFPSVGIWKNLYIEGYNESAIRYVVANAIESADKDSWVVLIDTYFANNAKEHVVGKLSYELQLNSVNLTTILDVDRIQNEYSDILLSGAITVPKAQVNTWWPNGYGAQVLYTLTVTFSNADETEITTQAVRIGFRKIELVQDALDDGLTFYFKVNDVPIFMKGSNEIPLDILPERGQNKTLIKKLLTTAKDSHMNMLRVWGGGVYESDYFYDVADELGILIWQDFMFACSLYPANQDYLSNVIDEIRHQTKRLASHTSIALFSGNNENEGALADNWYGTQENFTLYKDDYIKLYIDTVKSEFLRLTTNRGIFVSSSPSNGKETDEEGYVSSHPGNSLYGDVHYYNYILDSFESTIYPVPRFASEYGYQSLPSVSTILTVTNNISDLNINGDFLDHRQHHPLGNDEMKLLIDYQFKLPSESSDNYYKAFIYYGQVLHALSIKIESEHYRRYRSSLNEKGEGYTMGALYWQLNDVWVAPTWSGIDHTGKWKMLQYYTEEFFAPIIITGHLDALRNLNIYVVSDSLSPVESVTAYIYTYNWNSFEALSVTNLTVDLEAGASQLIDTFIVDDYLQEKGCGLLQDSRYNCFIYLSLEKDDVRIAPDNYVFPAKLKVSHPQQPEIKIDSIKKISNEEVYELNVTTNKISLFVWLETDKINGKFSENGFVQVNSSRIIYFYSEEATTVEKLLEDITVTNLLDEEYL